MNAFDWCFFFFVSFGGGSRGRRRLINEIRHSLTFQEIVHFAWFGLNIVLGCGLVTEGRMEPQVGEWHCGTISMEMSFCLLVAVVDL